MIFAGFSEILIFAVNSSDPLCLEAASLYTPPNAGQSSEVINFVPTPHEVIGAPCAFKLEIRFSSRSPEAAMTASGKPASLSIIRAFLVR